MKEASDAFQESLSCLSNDAAIIRQLSSLQITTGIIATQESGTTSSYGNGNVTSNVTSKSNFNRNGNSNSNHQDCENIDPNIDHHRSKSMPKPKSSQSQIYQSEINKSMIQQLNGIHEILSQLESKVSTISHVLQEEQSAMQALLQTKASALAQTQIIEEIQQNLRDQELNELLPGNGLLKINHSLDTLGVLRQHKNINCNANANANISHGVKGQVHRISHKKYLTPKHKPKPKTTLPEIILRTITHAEFQSISKNIRGRITLSALNEALHDIQRVTLQKYIQIHNLHSHSHRKGSSSSSLINGVGSGNANGSANANGNGTMHCLHKEEGEDLPFVSEQDLRDDCAFFRTGESTARAILQILRSCKRIKQVFWTGTGMDSGGTPGGGVGLNGNEALVTYVWLNGQD